MKIRVDSWKFHAAVVALYVVISTPLTWWLGVLYPQLRWPIECITNTTNMVALGYAVYIYYLFDTGKEEAKRKAMEKGLEVPSVEELMGNIMARIKSLDDWWKKNEKKIESFMGVIERVDLEKVARAIEKMQPDLDKFVGNGKELPPPPPLPPPRKVA